VKSKKLFAKKLQEHQEAMIAAKAFLVCCVIALSAFYPAVTKVTSSKFSLDPTLDDSMFTTNVILDTTVRSKQHCASACSENTCCQGMTFTKGQNASTGSCRGDSKSYFGHLGASLTSVGSRSYLRKKQRPCCELFYLYFFNLWFYVIAFSFYENKSQNYLIHYRFFFVTSQWKLLPMHFIFPKRFVNFDG
jgi:hypothetical protein